MGRTETRPVKMTATDGTEVTVRIPTGPIVEPSDEAKAIWEMLVNEGHWKYGTYAMVTEDLWLAQAVADCLDYYTGGHEVEVGFADTDEDEECLLAVIWSKGYYNYVGA